MHTNAADFGAVGDGRTLNTSAFQAAIEACRQAGGGTVYIPSGCYVTGSLMMCDNLTLDLDAGATLLGSENPSDYPVIESRWEGTDQKTYAPLIGGQRLTNVAVVGRGRVDGRGAGWWQAHRKKELAYPRPRLISLVNCANVLIRDITATQSPSWTINPVWCENVTVDHVTIVNPPDSPNTDGINPDSCRNVHISNCHVDVGDDCVTIKSGTENNAQGLQAPCENITITNCTMVHGHGGVVIGSETSGGVRNVAISNCVFVGTDRGIRMKSRRGRGGAVEDIRVTNIVMQDVLCPIIMNLYYACGAWGNQENADKRPHPVTEGTPRFRRIHLSHITAREVKYAAAFLYGLPEMPMEDISLSDISISMSPEAQAGYPDMADDMELMQRAGLYIRNGRRVHLHNVEVSGQAGPAFMLMDAADIDLSASTTHTPCADAPVVLMQNVDGAYVHGCQASAGTDTFLRVEGALSKEIALDGNHFVRARQAVFLTDGARPDAVMA
jgi:polygalacturonase